jgi:hypothetical protein
MSIIIKSETITYTNDGPIYNSINSCIEFPRCDGVGGDRLCVSTYGNETDYIFQNSTGTALIGYWSG